MALNLWARLTWSKSLFGLLLLNLVWSASFFIAPFTIRPGSVTMLVGGANQLDHESLWETLWIYPRLVYTFGDIQCHQLWYRSFLINGNQMPMCERMISMYLFANLGLVSAAFAAPSISAGRVMVSAMPSWVRRRLERLSPEWAATLIVVVALLPMAIDGFTQLLTTYESDWVKRVITGGLSGYVGGLLVGAMLVSIRQFSAEIETLRAVRPPVSPD